MCILKKFIFKGEKIETKNVNHSSINGKIAMNGTEFGKQKNCNYCFCNTTECVLFLHRFKSPKWNSKPHMYEYVANVMTIWRAKRAVIIKNGSLRSDILSVFYEGKIVKLHFHWVSLHTADDKLSTSTYTQCQLEISRWNC